MPDDPIKPWRLLDSTVVFDSYTKIEQRTYEMPDGAVKDFYIKLGGLVVCALAITTDNKVILVRQYRPGPNAILDELPGGGMEAGETPEQAMARELREETGYEGNLQLVAECYDDAYVTTSRFCFVATDCKKVGKQELDDSEFIDVKLVDVPEILQLVRSGRMTDIEVALLGLDRLGLLKD